MLDRSEPAVWVVAGCLFEVSVPDAGGTSWRWEPSGSEVTLLGDAVGEDRHRFRFRAEASGAEAGTVELRFRSGDLERTVVVRIAPEADLAP